MVQQRQIQLRNGQMATLSESAMKPGDAGVRRTIENMVSLALNDVNDPVIQRVAASLRRSTDAETALATFEWMAANYDYHTDGPDEWLTSPWISVRKVSPYKQFDCDDMSMLLACLLMANGMRVAYKAIAWRETNPPKQYTHVYDLVRINMGSGTAVWMPLDPVMKRDGFGAERAPIYRSYIVPIQESQGLSDDAAVTDWNAIGTEVARRVVSGENVGAIMQDVGRRICVSGVKNELKDKAPLLIAGGVVLTGALVGAGYLIGRHTARKARSASGRTRKAAA